MLYNLFSLLILLFFMLILSYYKEDVVEFKKLANKIEKSKRS